MIALTSDELLQWSKSSTAQWRKFFAEHPEALAIACDTAGTSTVAGLLQHIVAVELRYAERLADLPVTDYANLPSTNAEEIFAVHDRATDIYRQLLADDAYPWEDELDMATRTMGTIIAPRKAVFFHALLHGMRHYAQLATLLRQNGLKTTWPQDYLMAVARRG